MMHAPASGFRRAAPATLPVAGILLGPVTPAEYLRLRREHASLTIRQLAGRLAINSDQLAMVIAMLHLLETPRTVARHRDTIRAIARVLPFDAAVYWQLATDPVDAHPQVCRGCGYTVWDAYSVEDQLLGWATDTSCTRCAPGADADL